MEVKVIEIQAKTSGFDKAKAQIDAVDNSQENLNQSTFEYGTVLNKTEGALQGMLSKVNILGVNLGEVYGQLKNTVTGFGSVVKGSKSVIAGINLTTIATTKFAIALAKTGITLVVIALGALVAAFLSSQKGMDAANKVIQPLIAQFQTLIGVVQDISMHLGKLFSGDIIGFFKGAKEATSGFSEKMAEAADKGKRLAEITKEMSQASIELAKVTANSNVQLEEANSILQDVNASAEDRAKAEISAKEAINLKYDAEAKLMELELEALKIKQSMNDSSDADLLKLAELEAAYTSLTAARTKELTVITKKGNAAAKQAEAEAKSIIKAKQDELKAKAQLEAEYEQGRLEAQREFEDFNNSLIEDNEKRNLAIQETKRKRIIEDIEFETQLLQEKYKGDVEKLAQLEADKLTTIQNADLALANYKLEQEQIAEQKRIEEEEKAEQKRIKEEEKALKDLRTLEEKRRLILQEYKLLDLEGEELENEQALIDREEELATLRSQLEENLLTEEEFKDLEQQGEERHIAKLKEINDKYRAEEKAANLANIQSKIGIAQSYASAVTDLTAGIFAMTESFGKQDEKSDLARKKRQFKVNKALNLVNAGIGLAMGITTSLASAPLAIGPIPNPAGIASLVAVTTSGLAQIATIAAKKFDGGETQVTSEQTTPDVSSIDSASSTSQGEQTPNFNLFGDPNQGSTAQEVSSNEITPSGQVLRAVVVESDITGTQQRLSTIEQASEL